MERGIVEKVYIGPVLARKTARLLDRVKNMQRHGRKKVIVIKAVRERSELESEAFISDHDGNEIPGYEIVAEHPEKILELLQNRLTKGETFRIVALDGIHFFGPKIIQVIRMLLSFGYSIIASGLSFNSQGEPYFSTGAICLLSENVERCYSWCKRCGAEAYNYSQEIWDEKNKTYRFEPRCDNCFEPPEEK